MQFGLGIVYHQTNTFSHVSTEFEDIQTVIPPGEIADESSRSTIRENWRGIISGCRANGIELVPLLCVATSSGGRLSEICLTRLTEAIDDSVNRQRGPLDGLILVLSGATIGDSIQNVDEFITARFSSGLGGLPATLILGNHANLTAKLVSQSSFIISQSAPGRDGHTTGILSVTSLAERVQSGSKFDQSFRTLPILLPVAAHRFDQQPLSEADAIRKELEAQPNTLSASIFGGSQHTDVEHAGASVVVVSRRESGSTREAVESLTTAFRNAVADIRIPARNAEEAIHEAIASGTRPNLIMDLGDSLDSGGTGDGTTILWALIDLGVQDAVIAPIVDPEAVRACVSAGVNSRIELPIAGKIDTRQGYPIDVRGRIKTIVDHVPDPISGDNATIPGRAVVLSVEARHRGSVDVVLVERRQQLSSLAQFQALGIDPCQRQIVAIKSSDISETDLSSISANVYLVLSPGITTPDPEFFEYQRVPRPMYPIDAI